MEELLKTVYRGWKSRLFKKEDSHPDEEVFASFLENKLSPDENEHLKSHFISCSQCTELLAMHIRLMPSKAEPELSNALLDYAKGLLDKQLGERIFEIILRAKEKALELLDTTGEVLWQKELVPVPVLRSRGQQDFKDEVTIVKDFKDVRVEVEIENRPELRAFTLKIRATDKFTRTPIKDLRITLIKDDLELESRLCDFGRVTFEHVLLGRYTIELSSPKDKLASVLLDIKS